MRTLPRDLRGLASTVLVSVVILFSTANLASAKSSGNLKVSTANIWFGGVPMGQSKSHVITLTNSGSSSLTISKANHTDASFKSDLQLPATLGAGKSVQVTVTFTPAFAGHVDAAFIFSSSASDPTVYLHVHGGGNTSAGSLAPSPSSLIFGGVQVGGSKQLTATVTNSGSSSVTLSAAAVNAAQFSVNGPTMPLTLASGHSATFNVTFTPTNTNTVNANLSVSSNLPNLVIPLSGTAGASGVLKITPGSLSFGKVTVGSNGSTPASLTASGASVTVSAASVNNPEFSMSGISFPVTIPAGKSVSFTAVFTPQSPGAASAKFTFNSTASDSSVSEALAGTGMAATTHSVGLSWQPSTSNVEGYNVYRGPATAGPYARLNSSLDGDTSYTDSTIQSGNTYFYVTTAVGTDGVESAYSNPAEAIIP